jgi:hypothetical protein
LEATHDAASFLCLPDDRTCRSFPLAYVSKGQFLTIKRLNFDSGDLPPHPISSSELCFRTKAHLFNKSSLLLRRLILWHDSCIRPQRRCQQNLTQGAKPTMSIEKKSLINALKTTKKVNVAAPATNEGSTSRKIAVNKTVGSRLKRLSRSR